MKALLIRHASASAQAPDAPLTEAGAAQAEALIPWLTDLGAGPLYASPYARAQATIAPYAKASGQSVTVLDDLRERLLSPVSLPDWKTHIERSFEDEAYAAPGGESHAEVIARAGAAFAAIEAAGGALPCFVTHGGLSAACFHRADQSFDFAGWLSLRNPDPFVVTLHGGQITDFHRKEPQT